MITHARLLTILDAAKAYRSALESIASTLDAAQAAGEGTQAHRDLTFTACAMLPTLRLDLATADRTIDHESDRLALRAGKARRERERLARRRSEKCVGEHHLRSTEGQPLATPDMSFLKRKT